MTNDKFKPTASFNQGSNVPKTYEQFILEEQSEQDQKVADSYAEEFGSYGGIGVQKGYGPCTDSNCTHTFYLHLTIGYEGNFGGNGYYFTEGEDGPYYTAYTMNSISEARNLRGRFGNGSVWACNEIGAPSENTRRKNNQVIRALDAWIGVFNDGQSVKQTVDLGR